MKQGRAGWARVCVWGGVKVMCCDVGRGGVGSGWGEVKGCMPEGASFHPSGE